MKGVWLLSWRHLLHHPAQSAILIVCIATAFLVPIAAKTLVARFERELATRASATPLLAGARGNRVDLVLASLHFRDAELDDVRYGFVEELRDEAPGASVIPLHLGFTAQGHPIVGTDPDYARLRGLRCAEGELPVVIGEAAIGADVAAALELGAGDEIWSDVKSLYGLDQPVTVILRVTGVLARTGGPDDGAVVTSLRTTWMLAGKLHGHDEATELSDEDVIGRTDDAVVVNSSVIEANRVTPETAASFHLHGDEADMPVTAVIVVPVSDKQATIVKSAVNVSETRRMVVPEEVVDELMAVVFRIKRLFDSVSTALVLSTALMTTLVVLLSMRIRRREMETLHRIGCRRSTVRLLYATEIGIILVASAVLAGVGTLAITTWTPRFVEMVG